MLITNNTFIKKTKFSFLLFFLLFLVSFLIIKNYELKKTKERIFFLESKNLQLEKENKDMHELIVYNISNGVAMKKKIAFLTFDDGPSENSTKIIEILKKNNIKANFFVLGTQVDIFPEIIKDISKEGHGIFIHSNTHEYDNIYKSPYSLKKDIQEVIQKIEALKISSPKIYRFPGGSNNEYLKNEFFLEIQDFFKKNEITYIDWNVDSGDSSSQNIPPEKIFNNTIKQSKEKKIINILMHDTKLKKTTLEALPKIINELKNLNFIFLVIPNGVYGPAFK